MSLANVLAIGHAGLGVALVVARDTLERDAELLGLGGLAGLLEGEPHAALDALALCHRTSGQRGADADLDDLTGAIGALRVAALAPPQPVSARARTTNAPRRWRAMRSVAHLHIMPPLTSCTCLHVYTDTAQWPLCRSSRTARLLNHAFATSDASTSASMRICLSFESQSALVNHEQGAPLTGRPVRYAMTVKRLTTLAEIRLANLVVGEQFCAGSGQLDLAGFEDVATVGDRRAPGWRSARRAGS